MTPPSNRGRLINSESAQPSTRLGITRNRAFSQLLGKTGISHIRGSDRFSPDLSNDKIQALSQLNIPFAAGISSHTASLMLGAKLYGELSMDELKSYALACFAFLAAGGNHSFHEVMVVAKNAGLPYKTGDYLACLPESFTNTGSFTMLQGQFPEFLSNNSAIQTSSETNLAGCSLN